MSSMTNPYAPPKAAVRDISMPGTSFVYADRSTRLGAALLDGIIGMLMVYAPMLIPVLFAAATEEPGGEPSSLYLVGFLGFVIGFAAWAFLNVKYVKANGQSIAKKILGIKVVRSDGSPASLNRIFWQRNVVNTLLGVIPAYSIIEVLFIFGETQQCLHDKIADTIVVKA